MLTQIPLQIKAQLPFKQNVSGFFARRLQTKHGGSGFGENWGNEAAKMRVPLCRMKQLSVDLLGKYASFFSYRSGV